MLSSRPGTAASIAILWSFGLEPFGLEPFDLEPFGLELADSFIGVPPNHKPQSPLCISSLKCLELRIHIFIHGRLLRLTVPSKIVFRGSGSGSSDDYKASRESPCEGSDNRHTLFHSTEARFSGGCWGGRGGPWRTSGILKTLCHLLVFVVRQLVCCRVHPATAGLVLFRFILVMRDAKRLELVV